MAHVVPMAYSDSSAEVVVRLFMDAVWRLHEAPMKIVCDRDPRFRHAMSQEFMRLMGVKVASTTPYHPQSDGHAERSNHTVERMLRCHVAENQEDWDLWVTPVEHTINDSTSAATGFSPFELVYGHAPATQLDFFMDAALEGGSRRRKGGRVAADKRGTAHELGKQFARQLQAARVNLQMVQQRMMEQFDARHRLQHIKVNDQVWVDGQHLTLSGDRGLKPKLRKLRHGPPLRVIECLYSDRQHELPEQDRGAPSAYRLELPVHWKVHDSFTADRPTPVQSGAKHFVGRQEEMAPPPVLVEGQKERLELIISTRFRKLVEQQFQRQFRDCEVVTVDILPKWQATCTEDILHWNYKLYPRHHFDVIWASPPCKEYSEAKTQGTPDLKLADRRVRRTREIIEFYDPAHFFIENPAGDALRGLHTRAVMKGLPEPLLTTYCKGHLCGQHPRYGFSPGGVCDTSRVPLLHHLFCELKLNERMKEESALVVMNLCYIDADSKD
eukprot:gene16415-biopygen16923